MSLPDLRVLPGVARRAPGRASQGRARALTPGQRRRRRRLDMVKDRTGYSHLYGLIATICGASIVAAGIFAVIGLYPRVMLRRGSSEHTANPLFFHDVARAYKGDAPSYRAVLHTLTTNREDLVLHISQQVYANATVARRKYLWANRAIRALILDLLTLGALATITALKK
jgi:hypothetical protein